MAMSKGTSHYNRQTWEDSNFPILCQTCLGKSCFITCEIRSSSLLSSGDNNFIRMMVDKYGSECKICQRPFTTYRWNPGAKMRYKKTEICQTCARAKNVCQTCLLDLQYGLPVQVRDSVLAINQDLPKDEINREYFNQQLDAAVADGAASETLAPFKSQAPSDVLLKMARSQPYYKRNRAHICSFWVKGECRRGEECPYRHEKPSDPDDPLADQNMKDRYYGTNDPVADKMMKRITEMPRPVPPEDKSITTVYVGMVSDKVTEKDLRDHFYQFGEIRSVSVVPKQNCAFVTYTTREATELAIDKSFQKLVIHGQKLSIRWGRSQGKKASNETERGPKLAPVPGLPVGSPIDYFSLGSSKPSASAGSASSLVIPGLPNPFSSPSKPGIHYPSQDPTRLGSSSVKLSSFHKD